MKPVVLFTDEHSWIGTTRRVYAATELPALYDLEAQARHLSDVIAGCEVQRELACAQSREQGYQAGLSQGREQAAAELADALVALERRYQQAAEESRSAIAALAIKVVKKIAGQVAPATWLQAQAECAAAEFSDVACLKLIVGPVYADQLKCRLSTAAAGVIADVQVDEALDAKACLLDTGRGCVMVDLDTQLEHIESLLNAGNRNAQDRV